MYIALTKHNIPITVKVALKPKTVAINPPIAAPIAIEK
jgi:hypothetical protein